MREIPKKITVITHYQKGDKGCGGDYGSVEILFDKEQVVDYGDYYHDKGTEKVDGFLDALRKIWGDKMPKVERKNKNDLPDWD